jgi:hypothetical protein
MYQDWAGDPYVQVVLLTPMKHEGTVHFSPISHEGHTAWTMKQRYVSLDRLESASSTEDLIESEEAKAARGLDR